MAVDNKDKFVRISPKTQSMIKELLQGKNGRSQKDIVEACVVFFYDNKQDPFNYEFDVLKAIQKLHNTVIGFFRVHERDQLRPLYDEFAKIAAELTKLNSGTVLKQLQVILSVQEKLSSSSNMQAKAINSFHVLLKENRSKYPKLFQLYLKEVDNKGTFAKRSEIDQKYLELFKTI